MSYILDALKKSEKERQQGTVPDLMTVQDVIVQKPKKGSLLPYLLLVALLLNGALLAWWLVPWQSKKPGVVTYSTVGKQLESKTVEYLSPDLTKTSDSQVIVAKKRPVPESETAVTKKEADSKKTVQQKKPKEQTTDKLTPSIDTGSSREIYSPVLQQTRITRQVPSEMKPTNKKVAPGENKVYNLDDLPLSIQQSLPPITISVSLYSDDPDSRMAKINGLMMREGEYLTADLKLEEITPDGVIFSYQSYRFRIGPK
jgi:general secretion pathway protein B